MKFFFSISLLIVLASCQKKYYCKQVVTFKNGDPEEINYWEVRGDLEKEESEKTYNYEDSTAVSVTDCL